MELEVVVDFNVQSLPKKTACIIGFAMNILREIFYIFVFHIFNLIASSQICIKLFYTKISMYYFPKNCELKQ